LVCRVSKRSQTVLAVASRHCCFFVAAHGFVWLMAQVLFVHSDLLSRLRDLPIICKDTTLLSAFQSLRCRRYGTGGVVKAGPQARSQANAAQSLNHTSWLAGDFEPFLRRLFRIFSLSNHKLLGRGHVSAHMWARHCLAAVQEGGQEADTSPEVIEPCPKSGAVLCDMQPPPAGLPTTTPHYRASHAGSCNRRLPTASRLSSPLPERPSDMISPAPELPAHKSVPRSLPKTVCADLDSTHRAETPEQDPEHALTLCNHPN
jgi:hypothetical protein